MLVVLGLIFKQGVLRRSGLPPATEHPPATCFSPSVGWTRESEKQKYQILVSQDELSLKIEEKLKKKQHKQPQHPTQTTNK